MVPLIQLSIHESFPSRHRPQTGIGSPSTERLSVWEEMQLLQTLGGTNSLSCRGIFLAFKLL